jgi:hypothetical protein
LLGICDNGSMPKRSSITKQPTDVNQLASFIVESTTSESIQPKKNPAAVALGKLGGLKGGKARAEKLSVHRRQQIATNAAKARWNKRRIQH